VRNGYCRLVGPHVEPLPSSPSPPLRFTPQARRERLIAAIAHVVAEEGYSAASVSKVVASAGVSRNTFYEHFANKEECFLAAYDATVEQVMTRVRAATLPTSSRRAALEAGFAAFLGFAAAEPELAWLCVVEVLAAGPRALARRDEAMRRFALFLEESRAEDDRPEVPRLMTEVIVGGIYEVIYGRILSRQTATLPQLVPDVLYVWLAPFVGVRRAAAARAEATARIAPVGGPLLAIADDLRPMGRT
jgi:AcrR family transcriptional regulator